MLVWRQTTIAPRAFACSAAIACVLPVSAGAFIDGRRSYSFRLFTTPLAMSDVRSSSDDSRCRFVDVGANLLDDMYGGVYRGKPRHEPDLHEVLDRAWSGGIDRIVCLAGTLEESRQAVETARKDPRLFCTVGVHPTRCNALGDTDETLHDYVEQLAAVAKEGMEDGTVVAVGEFGLDYARTEFCDVKAQKRGFVAQLEIAERTGLPLYLHNRDTGTDLLDMLRVHDAKWKAGGVVHSFDDTLELAMQFIELGFYIGINGCSLKTQQNLDVVREIPLSSIVIETDCPWCDIRATHAGHRFVTTVFSTKKEKQYEAGSCVKGRFEPCHIAQVAEVVAGAKSLDVTEVAEITRQNAYKLFRGLQKKGG